MYEVFTRLWLRDLRRETGHPVDLASVPDAEIDRIAAFGVDYLWLMGVWTLGDHGAQIAREHSGMQRDFDRLLPDWKPDDSVGSPYAITRYGVEPRFGGDKALESLRRRLDDRGIGLILDFVPNHVARDHRLLLEDPDLFVRERDGQIACGKDPYFPPWTDTAQLDHRLAATRRRLLETLRSVALRCDGVRCDMAMLVLDEVFERTWAGHPALPDAERAHGEFWVDAIDDVRGKHPSFIFIAEVYWNMELRLQRLGFDYTYDKVLYDRLLHDRAPALREHLAMDGDFQRRSVRFVENHDEPRIAAIMPDPGQRAAATLIALAGPGMRFLHEGQIEGRTIKSAIQLARRVDEEAEPSSLAFHHKLLRLLSHPALRSGRFRQLEPREASPGNITCDGFVAWRWEHRLGSAIVVVNYAPARGQCRLTVDMAGIAAREVTLADVFSGDRYVRSGDEMLDPNRGLFVDLPAWGVHGFVIERRG